MMKQINEDQWMEYQKLKERKEKIDTTSKKNILGVLRIVYTCIGITVFYGLSVLTGIGSYYLMYRFCLSTPIINISIYSYIVSAMGAVIGLIFWGSMIDPINEALEKIKYERSKRK